jgi:uncharacterized protein YneF (UPF0154 family)
MTEINPYQPIPTSYSGPFTTQQQKNLDQREAVRKRRARRELTEKLHNAGTGALIGGTGTVVASSMTAQAIAGMQWPENLILIPLVIPGGIIGGVYGWIKGPRKKLRPIPANDDQLRAMYLQMNQSQK